jgi:hypothetical protein
LSVFEWAFCPQTAMAAVACIALYYLLKLFKYLASIFETLSKLAFWIAAISRADRSNLAEIVKHLSRLFKG